MPDCYKCQSKNESLFFCEKCGALLPPGEQNPFAIFSFAEDFALDLDKLNKDYDLLLQQIHPDKFLHDKIENLLATQHVMLLNKAYKTLFSPRLRSEFLLAKKGIIVNQDGKDTLKPEPELLMEIFSLKEQVSQLDEIEEKANMKQELVNKLAKILADLSKYFADAAYELAAMETIRYRYYEKTLEELR